ncbi:NTP transferase domain-containing protein, partial [Streptomyces bottropensis]|uniref:NTP transferase domain-containing protein n=1 Tax=Streptomyces bottropensis TaxID=42235 RepID=UPI0036C1764F
MTAHEPPGDPGTEAFDAVVLAGGAARRLGGADKPALRVGGRALLDRVLTACAGAAPPRVGARPPPPPPAPRGGPGGHPG